MAVIGGSEEFAVTLSCRPAWTLILDLPAIREHLTFPPWHPLGLVSPLSSKVPVIYNLTHFPSPGADMSHIICEPLAAAVIKTYSPNLMVHPLMRSQSHSNPTVSDPPASQIAEPIISMLSRLHVLVIGPGLGRDSLMQETCALVITAARERSLPFVLDADGLYLAQTRPELVQGYPLCILTPNVVEFARLAKSKGITISNDNEDQAGELARAFGGVTVLQKGAKDYISNGETSYVSDGEGGRKRSGGQGDTLTGSLATFLAWRKAYLDRIWECVP